MPEDNAMVIAFEQTVADVIASLERDLGLTSAEVAGGLGVTTRTLDRWRKAESLPQRETRARLAQLESIRTYAVGLFHEDAKHWMRDSVPKFAGLTPAEVVRSGRIDRVELVLAAAEHGIYI